MAVPLLSLSPLQDRGHHSWLQGRTRFHAIGAITVGPGMLVLLGGLKQVWRATKRTRAPCAGPAAAQPQAVCAPRGWRLLRAPPLSGGAGGPAGNPPVGAGSPAHPKPLSLGAVQVGPGGIGVPPKRGLALPSLTQTDTRTPPGLTRAARFVRPRTP